MWFWGRVVAEVFGARFWEECFWLCFWKGFLKKGFLIIFGEGGCGGFWGEVLERCFW